MESFPALKAKIQRLELAAIGTHSGEFFLFLAQVYIIFILLEFILLFWGPLEGKLRKKTRSLKVMTQVRAFTPSFSTCAKTRREEWRQANAVKETSKCSPKAAGSRGESGVTSYLAETQPLPSIAGVTSGCHTGPIPGKERGEGLCFVREGWPPQAAGLRQGAGEGNQEEDSRTKEEFQWEGWGRVWRNRRKKRYCKLRSAGKGWVDVS